MPTLRQQIAQMLIMGFDGLHADEGSVVQQWVAKEAIGGVILFDYDLQTKLRGKNLKDFTQIKQLTTKLQRLSNNPDNLPLFIAIDYEGGMVDRLKSLQNAPKTLTPYDFAKLLPQLQIEEAKTMAQTLQNLGFNLNFAPVVDLSIKEDEGIIGKLGRSFSRNPEVVAEVAERFVKVFKDYDIRCCFKHFPGHGSAVGDTHLGFVDVTNTFHPDELVPYSLLFKKITSPVMVMTAHVINRHLDETGAPATLSPLILTELLRNTIGFDGVIVSDDLQMQAISAHYSLPDMLQLTINAGADMMIFGNQWGSHSATEIIDTIESHVANGVIAAERIQASYQRISHLKTFYG